MQKSNQSIWKPHHEDGSDEPVGRFQDQRLPRFRKQGALLDQELHATGSPDRDVTSSLKRLVVLRHGNASDEGGNREVRDFLAEPDESLLDCCDCCFYPTPPKVYPRSGGRETCVRQGMLWRSVAVTSLTCIHFCRNSSISIFVLDSSLSN